MCLCVLFVGCWAVFLKYIVCRIDGTIPAALSKLTKLSKLYLDTNELGECVFVSAVVYGGGDAWVHQCVFDEWFVCACECVWLSCDCYVVAG